MRPCISSIHTRKKLERTRIKTEWFKRPYEKSVVIAAYAANSSGGQRMSSPHMPCIALKGLILD